MILINEHNIPQELRSIDQWVLWKIVMRDGNQTKMPYQINGAAAKSNDHETWSSFSDCMKRFAIGSWEGIGFVFSVEDPYCGIDLDGCRNPETGVIEKWAKDIIVGFDSYAEVSPSKTGVKIWVKGNWPYNGHKIEIDAPSTSTKKPAIEVYDSVRYFAVTGQRMSGMRTIRERQDLLHDLRKQFWKETVSAPSPSMDWRCESSVMDRAAKYLERMPVSVSGENGSAKCFHAACVLVQGFDLSPDQAMALMRVWNQGCQPPWSERELQHKIDDANRLIGDRGYLRNASPQRYDRISIPDYTKAKKKEDEIKPPDIQITTLEDAAREHLKRVSSGDIKLIDLGLPELDYAIGGGVEAGEMIVFAARPSHGKSMAALQVIHHFTAWGTPAMFISEEMSSLAIGKRALQFLSDVPSQQWANRTQAVEDHVQEHFKPRAPCYIVEKCRTVDRVVEQIKYFVSDKNVKLVVIDYLQQLARPGKNRYEEVTRVSQILKHTASECNIPMIVLAQLSRAIESRPQFVPIMGDLKESGQIEQDADLIVFQVWPHRIDSNQSPHKYKLYIGKNRNRATLNPVVTCKFEPSRQTLKVEHQTMDDAESFDATSINWNTP